MKRGTERGRSLRKRIGGLNDAFALLMVGGVVLLASCASRTMPSGGKKLTHVVYQVAYGTDRKPLIHKGIVHGYQGKCGKFSYGVAEVSIPNTHRVGQLERPVWWRLEWNPKVGKHLVLQAVTSQDSAAFFKELRAKMKQRDQRKRRS